MGCVRSRIYSKQLNTDVGITLDQFQGLLVEFLAARHSYPASDDLSVSIEPTRPFIQAQNQMEFDNCPDAFSPTAAS